MIKTQTKAESKFLRRILPHYYKVRRANGSAVLASASQSHPRLIRMLWSA